MVRLSKPVEGGMTKQTKMEHLNIVWKQSGNKPQELADVPEPPPELLYLWDWLGELTYPMSFAELEAWGRLTGHTLCRWEVEALVKLDRVRGNG